MSRNFAGKKFHLGGSSSQPNPNEDFTINNENHQKPSRGRNWSEQDNAIFAEILQEHYWIGNFPGGNPKKGVWPEIVETLNRRTFTNYTKDTVLTRFKNMKAEFRILYQLSNKSGWGWDSIAKKATTSDEIWDEVIQANPRLARFKDKSFPHYEIFERICGDNIAMGGYAQSNLRHSGNTVYDVEEDEFDDFIESNNNTNKVTEEIPTPMDDSQQNSGGTKRSGEKLAQKRRPRKSNRAEYDTLAQAQIELNRKAQYILEKNSNMMADCYKKLYDIPGLTSQAKLAAIDALVASAEVRTVFMLLSGDDLVDWLEHIVRHHPTYSSCAVWL